MKANLIRFFWKSVGVLGKPKSKFVLFGGSCLGIEMWRSILFPPLTCAGAGGGGNSVDVLDEPRGPFGGCDVNDARLGEFGENWNCGALCRGDGGGKWNSLLLFLAEGGAR